MTPTPDVSPWFRIYANGNLKPFIARKTNCRAHVANSIPHLIYYARIFLPKINVTKHVYGCNVNDEMRQNLQYSLNLFFILLISVEIFSRWNCLLIFLTFSIVSVLKGVLFLLFCQNAPMLLDLMSSLLHLCSACTCGAFRTFSSVTWGHASQCVLYWHQIQFSAGRVMWVSAMYCHFL